MLVADAKTHLKEVFQEGVDQDEGGGAQEREDEGRTEADIIERRQELQHPAAAAARRCGVGHCFVCSLAGSCSAAAAAPARLGLGQQPPDGPWLFVERDDAEWDREEVEHDKNPTRLDLVDPILLGRQQTTMVSVLSATSRQRLLSTRVQAACH